MRTGAALLAAAFVFGCSSGSSDSTSGAARPVVEAALDCSDVDAIARPIAASVKETVSQLTGTPRSKGNGTGGLASLAAADAAITKATTPEATRAAIVLNVGLVRDDPQVAETVAGRLSDLLGALLVPAVPEVARVRCETGRTLDGRTAACYDLRLLVPDIPAERLTQMKELSRCNWASNRLKGDPEASALVTYVESKGVASNEGATLLLALRSGLDQPAPVASAPTPRSVSAAPARRVAKDTVTVDSLAWSKSRGSGAQSYANAVFAPGYGGAAGAAGTWVMTGLGATISNYSVKCLQAQFRDLASGQTRLVSSGPACTADIASNAHEVVLDGNKVAVGYALSQSSGTLTGIALAWGSPNYTVDTLAPDYLVDVSPGNVRVSGSVGNGRPDFTTLSESATVEVLLGVGVYAAPAVAPGLSATFSKSEWWGTLASPAPPALSTWNGYTVEQIQTSVVTALDEQYRAAIPSLTYEVFPGCSATLAEMNLCGNVVSRGSYLITRSTPGNPDRCNAACSAAYDSCRAQQTEGLVDGCVPLEVSCLVACEAATEAELSGDATFDVRLVRGLELLDFGSATLPPLTQGTQIAVDVGGTLPGLAAGTLWNICVGVTCLSNTTNLFPIPSGPVGFTARSTLTARACPAGPAALYLSIDEILVTQPAVWALDTMISVVQTQIGQAYPASSDLTLHVLDELFDANLKHQIDTATANALAAIRDALNGTLAATPLVPCAN